MSPNNNIIQQTTKLSLPKFDNMYTINVNEKDGG